MKKTKVERPLLSREIRDINYIHDNCDCYCHLDKSKIVVMSAPCSCSCIFKHKVSIGDTTTIDGMELIKYFKQNNDILSKII